MDNNIGERGCRWLAQGLKNGANTTIKKLSLDYNNKIGNAGCAALCEGLHSNQTLEHLGLEFCNLGPVSARYIAQVIFTPTTKINMLRLMGNKIQRKGFSSLAMG